MDNAEEQNTNHFNGDHQSKRQKITKPLYKPGIEGQVVLITGAAAGIGEAIAKQLAELKAKVAILDVNFEDLKKLEANIIDQGGTALAIQCDVSKKEQVFNAVKQIEASLGDVSVLVNNAALANFTSLSNLLVEKWIEAVDVNICGALHCFAAILPGMRRNGGGHIINLSCLGGRQAWAYGTVYGGSKFFLQGFSAAIRQELVPMNIKVTMIQPGATNTPLLTKFCDDEAESAIRSFTNVALKMSVLEAEDVADAVIYALTQPDRVSVNQLLLEPKLFPATFV